MKVYLCLTVNTKDCKTTFELRTTTDLLIRVHHVPDYPERTHYGTQ